MHYAISTAVQYRLNPELLVERLKRKREGSKLWDEVLMRASNLVVLIAIPVVAGLDLGRIQWSSLDSWFAVLGFAFIITSTVLINWAMAVNPHFEPTVRIQKDRGHKVITSGPYNIVRHPGYLAGILYTLSIPLIIGSVFTFIPVGVYAVLFIVRTSLEDSTLHEELDGYSEYAKEIKHNYFSASGSMHTSLWRAKWIVTCPTFQQHSRTVRNVTNYKRLPAAVYPLGVGG